MPRNTQTKVELYDEEKRWTIDQFRSRDAIVRLQSGSNQFESQKVNHKRRIIMRFYVAKISSAFAA